MEAQMRVGDFNVTSYKFDKLDKKTLNRFLGKTTTFVLPKDYSTSAFKSILDDVWNVTPFVIVTEDDFDDSTIKVDDALAQFTNIGLTRITSGGMHVDYSFHIIDFHVVDELKKKPKLGDMKWYSSKIASIYFTADISIRQQAGAFSSGFYGDLLNFKLGYLKNYLQFVNNSIKANVSSNLYDDFSKPELANLKNKTLYIDKNFLYGYNAWSVKEKEAPEIEELTADFSFDYKVVEYDEIESMILNKDSDEFYYLVYNQINSDKIITVINGKTGDIVYQEHTMVSYNLKSKDFKELDKQIKKIK
jgi:hypothetical protein